MNLLFVSMYTATVCEAKSVGLARYPTVFGNSSAEVRCADNSHRKGSDFQVFCDASGTWSGGQTPQCLCNEGYRAVTKSGRGTCEGSIEKLNVYSSVTLHSVYFSSSKLSC